MKFFFSAFSHIRLEMHSELSQASKLELFTKAVPLDETHSVVVGGLIHQEVSPKCNNEESSTERHRYNRQVNRSPQL